MQYVSKTSWTESISKFSWRRVSSNSLTYWYVLRTSWNVLKTNNSSWLRCLGNFLKTSSEGVWLKWIYSPWSRRHLLKSKTQDVFIKMNVCWDRCLSDIFTSMFRKDFERHCNLLFLYSTCSKKILLFGIPLSCFHQNISRCTSSFFFGMKELRRIIITLVNLKFY